MRLLNPTDDELNAAFAEKVAGWMRLPPPYGPIGVMSWSNPNNEYASNRVTMHKNGSLSFHGSNDCWPNFVNSADAVLPWLEKWPHGFEIERVYSERYAIRVMAGKYTGGATRPVFWAEEKTFPRACVIALLRANGVEIEFT